MATYTNLVRFSQNSLYCFNSVVEAKPACNTTSGERKWQKVLFLIPLYRVIIQPVLGSNL